MKNKSNDKFMWKPVMTSRQGFEYETEFSTPEAAQSAIDKMREAAVQRDAQWRQWRDIHPQPWTEEESHTAFVHGYYHDTSPLQEFEERGWHVEKIPASPSVYRTNTLPNSSESLRKEIEAKMAMFGVCDLNWSCFGHGRARWQSDAAAEQLKAIHPEWIVTNEGHYVRMSIPA